MMRPSLKHRPKTSKKDKKERNGLVVDPEVGSGGGVGAGASIAGFPASSFFLFLMLDRNCWMLCVASSFSGFFSNGYLL